ncbi:Sigma factor sigB regulation protein rsbQ [Glycine soja]|uniref:Sigma factor sigB regulation protein rsbQ n=1 Tax=Glycine soja TaxID=3848 RepID=A0A0B2PE33_GLYSO|nr:Sigma factor sigB regulation protein rsbQ [Glycine soja]
MGTSILDALNVRVEGSGDKYLFLAHGFGTDQSAWQRVLPYFTRNYSVILYDLVCAGSVNPDHFDYRPSIRRPDLFSKLILIGASPRFLNDKDYHGGFEQGEIEQVFSAMEANYEAWVNGFAPLSVGAAAVREFSRTLFNMRPDISLFVSRTVFHSDLRGILGLVNVPCCIMQTARDMSVPASVATYMRDHIAGKSTIQ